MTVRTKGLGCKAVHYKMLSINKGQYGRPGREADESNARGGKAAWESDVKGQSATPNAHEMPSLLDVQAHHLCHIRKET